MPLPLASGSALRRSRLLPGALAGALLLELVMRHLVQPLMAVAGLVEHEGAR